MSIVYIYGLFDPRNNQLRYVGKAKNPSQRLYFHIKGIERKNSLTHKEAWIKQLVNLGCYPILEILEEVDEKDWKNAETWWIDLIKSLGYSLTNMTIGGDGFSSGIYHYLYGKHISEEQKKNLSISRMGSNNPMHGKVGANKGKIFSESHKENLRLSHLGKKQSVETREKRKISLSGENNHQYGKVRSESHCRKISEARKGKSLSDETKRKISESVKKARMKLKDNV